MLEEISNLLQIGYIKYQPYIMLYVGALVISAWKAPGIFRLLMISLYVLLPAGFCWYLVWSEKWLGLAYLLLIILSSMVVASSFNAEINADKYKKLRIYIDEFPSLKSMIGQDKKVMTFMYAEIQTEYEKLAKQDAKKNLIPSIED